MSLYRGGLVPDCVLPSHGGIHTRLFSIVGTRPQLIVAITGDEIPPELLDQLPSNAVVIATAAPKKDDGPLVLADTEGAVRKQLGTRPDARWLAIAVDRLGRARRITHVYDEGDDWLEPITKVLQELNGEKLCAPLLQIPDVLEPHVCAHLRDLLDEDATQTPRELPTERRADLVVPQASARLERAIRDTSLLRNLTSAIGRSVMPQIRRTFGVRVTRFEGFRVVAYDAELGSHFAPHRDNLTPSTASRQISLTLNLNDDYEGGELELTEFGERIRGPAGHALLHSAGLMHEAHPVSSGRRYVLISHLHAGAPPAARTDADE